MKPVTLPPACLSSLSLSISIYLPLPSPVASLFHSIDSSDSIQFNPLILFFSLPRISFSPLLYSTLIFILLSSAPLFILLSSAPLFILLFYTAISAWNDNGLQPLVKNPEALFRSDFFPGLGWMLSRAIWEVISTLFSTSCLYLFLFLLSVFLFLPFF